MEPKVLQVLPVKQVKQVQLALLELKAPQELRVTKVTLAMPV